MDASGKRQWLPAATLIGLAYFVVGFGFAALAGAAASQPMRIAWRLGAWVASAAVFAAHLWYEQFRVRAAPRTTAWHAALAVTLGAFGLAVAASVHALAASRFRPAYLLALVAWPAATALPAFVVALALAAGLTRMRRNA